MPLDIAAGPRVLRVDASMRKTGSVTRELSDHLIDALKTEAGDVRTLTRDLTEALPFVHEDWINANFTDPAERTAEQRAVLAQSDALVEEIMAADVLVIGVPVYNFGIPAALKAWVDLITRARLTFRYTENGPEGLLKGKTAVLVMASGGTDANSQIDFATPYMRHVLGFVGITDVVEITADALMKAGPEKLEAIRDTMTTLARTLAVREPAA